MTRRVYVLCEGFHDRDFLAGWFEHVAGWRSKPGGRTRPRTSEFADESPLRGAFDFEHGMCDISLAPCSGRQKITKLLRRWLRERALRDLGYDGVAVIADGDHVAVATASDPIESLVRHELAAAGSPPSGPLPWLHFDSTVDMVSMKAGPIDDVEDLPQLESLERVVATAFARAYPTRWQSLIAWLLSRPKPPEPLDKTAKTAMWTVMAGWFGEQGCGDFLRRAIWQDAPLRQSLVEVLVPCGLAAFEQRLRGA